MNVGKLVKIIPLSEETLEIYTGSIQTLEFSIDYFSLIANPFRSPGTKRPDYLVYGRNPKGEKVEIGVGWHREFARNEIKGEMISLSFDDPSFKKPLHVTAFKDTDENHWPITWQRERAKPNV
jgi:uncharacterized protein (DUF736 family)